MEQGGMERTRRLPSAPSRLPLMGGGTRIQLPGQMMGLPRLFIKPPATNATDLGPPALQAPVVAAHPPAPPQHPEMEDLTPEEQEWRSWVGKRVCISGIKKGTLMYYGTTSFAEGLFCGISLDEPEGRHDGELNGRRYFYCQDKHGVLAPVSKVEKITTPRLPPISPQSVSTEEINRTFTAGKSPIPFSGSLNNTFVAVKSQSIGSLDKTYSISESPTGTYPIHRGHQFTGSSPEERQCHFDDDESSLGLLTDSQMGDFSLEGLLLMPKTQSCDDIHELPEHEVVQDITVQYLEESGCIDERFPMMQSTPLDRVDIKLHSADFSLSDDRSFSMIGDQEFPSCALDFSMGTVNEGKYSPASDDVSQQLVSTEMSYEEPIPGATSANVKDISINFKENTRKVPPETVPNNVPVIMPVLPPEDLPNTTTLLSKTFNGPAGDNNCASISKEDVISAIVSSVAKSCNLPQDILSKLTTSITEASANTLDALCAAAAKSVVERPAQSSTPIEVQLREKGQRSLDSSLTKSVEWNDVVLVQHSGEELKEERLSIEKVMEEMQAKGTSGQRPASTYTVGSADTGYQGDGEFDMQSEIETSSPCDEVKPLVSSSVSTSFSLDDVNSSANNKMGKSGHLSDSDFFTEDPGETEEDCGLPSPAGKEVDRHGSMENSTEDLNVLDVTVVEVVISHTDHPEQEAEVDQIQSEDQASANVNVNEHGEDTEAVKEDTTEDGIPKKNKKLPHSSSIPPKKIVGVSKIKALLESQPSVEQPKRVRTPRKNRWDAVTSKIQAGMAEDKVKPKREIKGRVNTNLVSARAPPPPVSKKTDGLPLTRIGSMEVVGSAGPGSTRSTPVTESLNLPVDGDDTASQATTSARATPSSVASSYSQSPMGMAGAMSLCSTASAMSSSSSQCSLVCSIPSISHQQQPAHKGAGNSRLPSKIAVRWHPRLEPVANVSEVPKKASARSTRAPVPKMQRMASQASKGVTFEPMVPQALPKPATQQTQPSVRPKVPTIIRATRPVVGKEQQTKATKTVVKGSAAPTPATPTTPQTRNPPLGSGAISVSGGGVRATPIIRSSLSSTSSPLVIPSSSRQQRQKLEELGREVQHLGALCESRTKELNRVKMQLKHASLGFDAFATLVQYLAGELNAFSHPDLVTEIQTTKEQLITLETFLKQCEGDLDSMREKHVEEMNILSRQLQQSQGDTAQLQEKVEQAEKLHSKQCEDWDQERERILQEAQNRHQAALEITQAQHASQIEALQADHAKALEAFDVCHKGEQQALTAQLEQMKERCRELQEQARSIEEALQKDTDSKVQWLSAKNADLQKEVESLKSVLDMKQGELHELRKENQMMSKQTEELPVYRHRVSKLMTRIEELQALLREKSKNERKLSVDQRSLQEHLDKESKMNRQLSMEKDELMWRLSQSFTAGYTDNNSTAFMCTPDFVKKKRPIASTPFRLTPGSLPPFREDSPQQATPQRGSDESQVTSTTETKQYRARVRVNRTQSCHTSPRASPSHNSNSRMVTSTPNMPCDDENSIDDASSSTRLSPCDSLTELHLKALGCMDDTNELLNDQKQQLYSPNGISTPNSGSASMTSSAAEDLSLSSTEEDRPQDHVNTSPRSQAGEAMVAVEDTSASMTPELQRVGKVAAPSETTLTDAPCFCDDEYDISSEPE